MSGEQRYTLEEASREIAIRECAAHGHDFIHFGTTTNDLVKVTCERCGRAWRVVPDE